MSAMLVAPSAVSQISLKTVTFDGSSKARGWNTLTIMPSKFSLHF